MKSAWLPLAFMGLTAGALGYFWVGLGLVLASILALWFRMYR